MFYTVEQVWKSILTPSPGAPSPTSWTQKNRISQFFIILNKTAISCVSNSSLCDFEELFKAHFVFGTAYHTMLYNMFTFIQTTIYNIDVGKVKERPRTAEIRVSLLH